MGESRSYSPGQLTPRGGAAFAATGRRGAVTLAVLALLVACSEQTSGTVRGIVTAVEGDLEEVTSFTVLVEGSQLEFVPSEQGDYDFPLTHLREHQRTGEPVLVGWELVGSVRYALSLADG